MKLGLHHTRRTVVGVAVAALAAVTAVACSSGGDTTPNPKTADPALLGAQNVATGSAVTIGYISEGKAVAYDTSAEMVAAQVAVDYINEHLGGLRGHRIELKTCESKGNPAAAADCSNQMAGAGAVAVVEGALGLVDQTIDVLSPAGVPVVLDYANSAKSLTTPNVFGLLNGVTGIFGAPAELAKQKNVTKAALVTIDVPGATEVANQLGKLVFGNAGVQLDVVAIAPGTPDPTSQIAAANRSHPGMWTILGSTNFCSGVLKAIKTADREATVAVNDRCVDPTIASSIPGGFEGVRVGTTANLDPATEDVKVFQAAIDKYHPGLRIDANAAGGWQPMVGLARALNAVQGQDITRQSVSDGLRTAPPQPYPLTNGIQFQCDGKALALWPNVCENDFIVSTADKQGVLGAYQVLKADPSMFALPTR
ncbi:ABC transporter substrate-binding protein [Nocardia sp. alder85J]|uniref:ABC transporter substrate-binding protein n=1 Tax=Nocardia sp. alder85J TaxID=2862949 RepID=UPI001CD293A1|nr:ABC transporter substrate-binding protein [Nocardia sp. alder85J]MCX4095698.1 ABC transporter substrate-binding protein [Nocardia sp. alder85J]